MSDEATVRPARVVHEGRELVLDEADAARIAARARGMLGLLRSAAYLRARYRYPDAPLSAIFELAGSAIGTSGDLLRSSLPGGGRPLLSPASYSAADGTTWSVAESELEELDSALEHGSWLCASLYRAMKARTGSIEPSIALTAQLLGQSTEQVRGALEWHDNYMRWHDGDESYTVL